MNLLTGYRESVRCCVCVCAVLYLWKFVFVEVCICLFSCVFLWSEPADRSRAIVFGFLVVFLYCFFILNVYLYFVSVFVFLIWSKHPLTGDSIVLLRAELKSGDGVRQAAYDKGRSSIRMPIWSRQ